jgi:hypothetical protein
MVVPISRAQHQGYLEGRLTLRSILLEPVGDVVFLYDTDQKVEVILDSRRILPSRFLPPDYLPGENSFYPGASAPVFPAMMQLDVDQKGERMIFTGARSVRIAGELKSSYRTAA